MPKRCIKMTVMGRKRTRRAKANPLMNLPLERGAPISSRVAARLSGSLSAYKGPAMPSYPEALATIALLISIASFGVSACVAFRDKPGLVITSGLLPNSDSSTRSLIVACINKGRRQVIPRVLAALQRRGGAIARTSNTSTGSFVSERTNATITQFDRNKPLV